MNVRVSSRAAGVRLICWTGINSIQEPRLSSVKIEESDSWPLKTMTTARISCS
jgi:hypothetical protein